MDRDAPPPGLLTCHLCGRVHQRVAVKLGHRALCVDCGATLARRPLSRDAALAFTLTAAILAVPAVQLPLVTVRKFGAEHASYVWSGVRALWQEGMPLLAVWVALCGLVVPLALLTSLMMIITARVREFAGPARRWSRLARALQRWSMPEVQVLAVIVAFVKIDALVDVKPGTGLWFYAAMTFSMLLAWRSAELLDLP